MIPLNSQLIFGVIVKCEFSLFIQFDIDEALWDQEVCLDECKIRQILRNLLNNALKYRKEHLEIKIERKNGSLLIAVRDDGEGIPENYHQKIFECYFQMESGRE